MEHNSANVNDTVIVNGGSGTSSNNTNNSSNMEEHKKALMDLIECESFEIKTLRYYISYNTYQLEKAEKRLSDAKSKLASLEAKTKETHQGRSNTSSTTPIHRNEVGSSRNVQHHSKSHLPNHALSPRVRRPPIPMPGSRSSNNNPHRQLPTRKENVEIRITGTKRRFEEKQHKELIPLICKTSSPYPLKCETSNHISSQHKRRLRSLALCPVNDMLFATSALDGVVKLWEVHYRGSGASLRSSTDCLSPNHRRWPEDIAWHPDGNRLFSVYSANGEDSQISVMNLSTAQGKGRKDINFLEDKPHIKGVINNIAFLPREKSSFVTGGNDHGVILWSEDAEKKWHPKTLHGNLHTSSVMGVAGMQQKQIVLSVGKDKRILGYDAHAGKRDFIHQIDSKCFSVLPNPCDFNLFMVQAGTPEKQLRLFDVRTNGMEVHAFGWKQESSETQSAMINQAWSPNGLYITSGSADPMIHIFDIRYNGQSPSQSIHAHQKRLFKAMWLHSVPLLISISSDLNIGLHKIV